MSDQPQRRPVRRRKKKQDKKIFWIIGAAAVVLIAVIWLLIGTGDKMPQAHDPERGPLRELSVNAMTRQGETMVVDTSYMKLEFPYAFSDLIKVEAINQGNQTGLAFTAPIAGEDRKLYTIWFNGRDGEKVGAYDLGDGEKPVVVTLAFYSPAAKLEGDDRITFFATQETVNDIVSSMRKDAHFTVYE